MTENEAIEKLILSCDSCGSDNCRLCDEALEMVSKAFEELKQYRAIGTIEEFKDLKECVYVDERPFIFACPNCKEVYTLEQDERPSFCRKCNEKIDWNKVIFYQL